MKKAFDNFVSWEQRCQRLAGNSQPAFRDAVLPTVGVRNEKRIPVLDRCYRWCWALIRITPSKAGILFALVIGQERIAMIAHHDPLKSPLNQLEESVQNAQCWIILTSQALSEHCDNSQGSDHMITFGLLRMSESISEELQEALNRVFEETRTLKAGRG